MNCEIEVKKFTITSETSVCNIGTNENDELYIREDGWLHLALIKISYEV